MKRFVEGEDRSQVVLLPECLDDYVTADKFDKNALVRLALALAHLQAPADKVTQTRLARQQMRVASQRVGWALMLDQRAKNYSTQSFFLRRPFYGMGP